MFSINFRVMGKPVSKKNKLTRTRWGGMMYNKDSRVEGVVAAIQSAAYEAMTPDFPLADGCPFGMIVEFHCRSYGSGDIDGWCTTILDSLQGILYTNDKYCVSLKATKTIIGKKDQPFYRIWIDSYPQP